MTCIEQSAKMFGELNYVLLSTNFTEESKLAEWFKLSLGDRTLKLTFNRKHQHLLNLFSPGIDVNF